MDIPLHIITYSYLSQPIFSCSQGSLFDLAIQDILKAQRKQNTKLALQSKLTSYRLNSKPHSRNILFHLDRNIILNTEGKSNV